MTPEEEHRLIRLIEHVAGLPTVPKDPDAVSALAQLLRVRPDAAYWLLQRCLLLELTIEHALEVLWGGPSPGRDATRTEPGRMAAVSGAGQPESTMGSLLGGYVHTSLLADLADGEPPKPGTEPPPDGGPRRN